MQGLGWGRLAIALTQTLHPRCACARWVILPSRLHQRLIILGPAGRTREAMSMTVDVSLVLCARAYHADPISARRIQTASLQTLSRGLGAGQIGYYEYEDFRVCAVVSHDYRMDIPIGRFWSSSARYTYRST